MHTAHAARTHALKCGISKRTRPESPTGNAGRCERVCKVHTVSLLATRPAGSLDSVRNVSSFRYIQEGLT